MKNQHHTASTTAPEARFSFRRTKHSPAGKTYKGLIVSVAALHLRVKLHGTTPQSDFEAALGLCERERWKPVFTENIQRQLPEIRIGALASRPDEP